MKICIHIFISFYELINKKANKRVINKFVPFACIVKNLLTLYDVISLVALISFGCLFVGGEMLYKCINWNLF